MNEKERKEESDLLYLLINQAIEKANQLDVDEPPLGPLERPEVH